jgi:hypothetical protein
MLINPRNNWYTDTMRVKRETDVERGSLTDTERVEIMSAVPCRVYRNNAPNAKHGDVSASYAASDKLACALDVDIRAGDEILITRGGALGKGGEEARYFAGSPEKYYEPFGGIKAGLAHQEIPLSSEERIKRL